MTGPNDPLIAALRVLHHPTTETGLMCGEECACAGCLSPDGCEECVERDGHTQRVCAHCYGYGDDGYAVYVPWPCRTAAALSRSSLPCTTPILTMTRGGDHE